MPRERHCCGMWLCLCCLYIVSEYLVSYVYTWPWLSVLAGPGECLARQAAIYLEEMLETTDGYDEDEHKRGRGRGRKRHKRTTRNGQMHLAQGRGVCRVSPCAGGPPMWQQSSACMDRRGAIMAGCMAI